MLWGSTPKPGPHLIPLRRTRSRATLFFSRCSNGSVPIGAASRRRASVVRHRSTIVFCRIPSTAAVVNKTSSLPCMEDLAAPHATLIRSLQLSGPCLLAGHSFGGLLAFEVAHQLRREGIDVEMILLVDSWVKSPLLRHRIKLLTWARARWALNRRLKLLSSRAVRATKRIVSDSQSGYAPDSNREEVDQPFNELPFELREKIYRNARNSYRLRRLESRGVLFRSHDRRLGPLVDADRTIGWKDLFAGGLEIVETPGDHLSLLEDPHILTLAQRVSGCLAEYSSSQTNALVYSAEQGSGALAERSLAAPSS